MNFQGPWQIGSWKGRAQRHDTARRSHVVPGTARHGPTRPEVPSPEQLANYVKQAGTAGHRALPGTAGHSASWNLTGIGQVVDQLQKLIKGAPRNIQEPEQPFMWLAVFPGLDSNSCMDHYFFALCWMSRQMLVHNWHFCLNWLSEVLSDLPSKQQTSSNINVVLKLERRIKWQSLSKVSTTSGVQNWAMNQRDLHDWALSSQGNSTKKPLSAQSFLGILEDLEERQADTWQSHLSSSWYWKLL